MDDILLVGEQKAVDSRARWRLHERFELTDMGQAHHYLGMRVTRVNGVVHMDQEAYIQQLLDRAGLDAAYPVQTPMAYLLASDAREQHSPADIESYRSLSIGGLL